MAGRSDHHGVAQIEAEKVKQRAEEEKKKQAVAVTAGARDIQIQPQSAAQLGAPLVCNNSEEQEREGSRKGCLIAWCPCFAKCPWFAPCCILLVLAALIAMIVALATGGGGHHEPVGPLHCNVDNCAKPYVPEGAQSCAEAKCSVCQDGFQHHLGACFFKCSTDQQASGCAPLGCSLNSSCSACVPGFKLQKAGENLRGPAHVCTKETKPVTMNFFMYRAQAEDNHAPTNAVLASPAGVMWHLHNEVVDSCPRRFGISRVLRYNVTVHNPEAVFADHKGQFSHFMDFQWGKCRNPDCDQWWTNFGYSVGCQTESAHHYPEATFYSLPGPCPSEDLQGKSDECKSQAPGGNCIHPDGSGNCTWSAELVGNVSVDELSGIHDIKTFCADGKIEYSTKTDKGNGTDFWNGKQNETRNTERVAALLKLFDVHYPEVDTLAMPSPLCDGI